MSSDPARTTAGGAGSKIAHRVEQSSENGARSAQGGAGDGCRKGNTPAAKLAALNRGASRGDWARRQQIRGEEALQGNEVNGPTAQIGGRRRREIARGGARSRHAESPVWKSRESDVVERRERERESENYLVFN